MSDAPIEVLHVGSASRDLDRDDPRGWRLGRWGDLRRADDRAAGATDRGGRRGRCHRHAARASSTCSARPGSSFASCRLAESPVFRNVETPAGRIQTCRRPRAAAASASHLPAAWLAATAWSLVPVAGEIGEDWAPAVPERAYPGARLAGLAPRAGRGADGRAPVARRRRRCFAARTWSGSAATISHPGRARRICAGSSGRRPACSSPTASGAGSSFARGRDGARQRGAMRRDRGRTSRSTRPGPATPSSARSSRRSVRPSIVPDGEPAIGPDLAFAAAAASLVIEAPRPVRRPRPRAAVPRAAGAGSRRCLEPSVARRLGHRPLSADRRPPAKATQPPVQVGLEDRLGSAEQSTSLDDGETSQGGSRGRLPVAQPMLVHLGELDARDDGSASDARGQRFPRLGGLGVPAQAAQQVRPIDRDPLLAPRDVERRGSWRTESVATPGAACRRSRPAPLVTTMVPRHAVKGSRRSRGRRRGRPIRHAPRHGRDRRAPRPGGARW